MSLIQKKPVRKRGRPPKQKKLEIEDFYFNFDQPSTYAGAHLVQAAAKKKGHDPQKVLEWLESQKAYTLHKQVRWRFPRRMYNVRNVADTWEIDLADLRKLKDYNDNYKYVLTCIDVLSKFAFAEPLYDKTAVKVSEALDKIFKSCGNRLPLVVQSDK